MADEFLPERVESDGVSLAHLDVGAGPETIVFSHSYLVDSRQFEAQIEALASDYRVIAYDLRDHGASGRATSQYGMYDLVSDGERVIEALDAAPCHWVGLSTGGFVGMRAALRHPDWFSSVTLMDTSAAAEEPLSKAKNYALLAALRLVGIKPLIGQGMKAMFSDAFLEEPEFEEQRAVWRARMLANDRDALVRCGRAIFARDDVLEALGGLDVPIHAVAGDHDRGLPVRHVRDIANTARDGQLSIIENAGHLCTIERPDAVTDVLRGFIGEHASRG